MPIYEFHCPHCDLLLEFFSRRPSSAVPPCPHCGGTLSREVARFATGPSAPPVEDDALGSARLDEARVERAFDELGGDVDSLSNDSDPREAARKVRRFSEASGLAFSPDVKDMIARIEGGADPEKVGAELDNLVSEGAAPFAAENRVAESGAKPADAPASPRRDPVLRELPPEPLPPRKPSPWD